MSPHANIDSLHSTVQRQAKISKSMTPGDLENMFAIPRKLIGYSLTDIACDLENLFATPTFQ